MVVDGGRGNVMIRSERSVNSQHEPWLENNTASSVHHVPGSGPGSSESNHVFSWDESLSYERYAWLTGADVVLREDGYWLFYTGFSDVNPPENFLIGANIDWCDGAGDTCLCYVEEGGTEICLLESVTTFNLARRTR